MQARFLLGPAGSGKTFRCLGEIRAALRENPNGPPLLLLAPKQATFQIERQILSDPSLPGYTRLQILSFERLADFAAAEFSAPSGWLDDEGRVMILRALLARHQGDLKLFHATARLPGFAKRLGALLQEFQRHQLPPEKLAALAKKISSPPQLRDKLHDFALLASGYRDWLEAQHLTDANSLITFAAGKLAAGNWKLKIEHLWLDGFAEMTAQELDLLAAVIPHCRSATLAFCLDGEPAEKLSWRSPWAVVGQTFQSCRQRLGNLTGVEVSVETLKRNPQNRFGNNPALAHLEKNWANPIPNSQFPIPISAFSCANAEAEATLAAREILKFTRAGGRFREAAVFVRTFDGYADTLRRVFASYDIPVFLDRREAVAHHPLAELTRYALRLAAYGWRHGDWFGALKTGLARVPEAQVDALENAALAAGWDAKFWLSNVAEATDTDRLRREIVRPFKTFAAEISAPVTGEQLSAALENLWSQLEVAKTLDGWSGEHSALRTPHSAIHQTVWEQMQNWLDNLSRAFAAEKNSARDWLPIVESGLATLTVGVVPPALDQVVIGAIDRSRTADVKLALVLGLNEGIFPAPPREDPLLNDLERLELSAHKILLGPDARQQVGHEWFYGYIACTRAGQRLVLTCAQADARGNQLNRSPFFDHLEKLFPQLKLEDWRVPDGFDDIVHPREIVARAVRLQNEKIAAPELFALTQLTPALARARQLAAASAEKLSPAVADALYGRELQTSVSALEDFGACPFRFFVARGLRAQERKLFELDSRERGSFQHEVLKKFHDELVAEKLKWRDLTPDAACDRVRRIGGELLPAYQNGLFTAGGANRFAGETLLLALETLLGVLVGWARDYQFDPALVETGFGLQDESPWPAWRLDVGDGRTLALRGRVDRVDVWRDDATGATLAVVMDYKSSGREPNDLKLFHGVQLQLPAYLAALENIPEVRATLGVQKISAAGVFYINLRGEFEAAPSRAESLADPAAALREGFRHVGRYDETQLAKLDPRGLAGQFKTSKQSSDRMRTEEFRALLGRAVENLQRFGKEIFAGNISVAPFRKSSETACDFCDYASVCRFDPWTQPFRILKDGK